MDLFICNHVKISVGVATIFWITAWLQTGYVVTEIPIVSISHHILLSRQHLKWVVCPEWGCLTSGSDSLTSLTALWWCYKAFIVLNIRAKPLTSNWLQEEVGLLSPVTAAKGLGGRRSSRVRIVRIMNEINLLRELSGLRAHWSNSTIAMMIEISPSWRIIYTVGEIHLHVMN